jgi:hypothetical protein
MMGKSELVMEVSNSFCKWKGMIKSKIGNLGKSLLLPRAQVHLNIDDKSTQTRLDIVRELSTVVIEANGR